MHYLEDYIEVMEHLPQELRDRFTEMREMDLSVQNRVDSLERRQRDFFAGCDRMREPERHSHFERLRREYDRVIADASEKVQSAEEAYGLVDRYLRRLDQELHKFKLELEADNRGITEVLEKRSLEMDAQEAAAGDTTKENRLPKKNLKRSHTASSSSASSTSSLPIRPNPGSSSSNSRVRSISDAHKPDVPTVKVAPVEASPLTPSLASPSPAIAGILPKHQGVATIPIQHMGAGGNAIAAAASAAIAATQQMVSGRRTSSLKASYEAIHLGSTHEFSVGRELAAAGSGASATNFQGGSSGSLSAKRQRRTIAAVKPDLQEQPLGRDEPSCSSSLVTSPPAQPLPSFADSSSLPLAPLDGDHEWDLDPAEPRYCVCNQVSYGDMVACDNNDCPYEWFHYPCVGVTASPKGKWYCPTCMARMRGNARQQK